MPLTFDHLAIVAPTLQEGVGFVRAALGIDIPKGGAHPQMGTHNHLMRLGEDEFLEVIAVDPLAPKPAHPRWFGLDTLGARTGLGNWILRCDDLARTLAAFPPSAGLITDLQRGDLTWQIAVPDDGGLPFDGAFPTLIAWPPDKKHVPGALMPDLGCALVQLTISHPNARIVADRLSGLLTDPRIRFETAALPALKARIDTPQGLRSLGPLV